MKAQNPGESAKPMVCTEAEFSAKVPEIVKAARLVFITRRGRFIAAYIPIHLEDQREIISSRLKARFDAGELPGADQLDSGGPSVALEDIKSQLGANREL